MLKGNFVNLDGIKAIINALRYRGFENLDGIKAIINALGFRGFEMLINNTSHLYVICIILLFGSLLWRRGSRLPIVALCIVSSIVLHLQFALFGWFYRYEAYLVGVSLPVIGGLYFGFRETVLPRFLDRTKVRYWIALLGCTVLLVWPLHQRAIMSLEQVVRASNHIYRQQYHSADFLRKMYPPGVRVACNDLGAVSYYADPDILDLWGLGTIEVTRAKRMGKYDANTIEHLLKQRRTEVVMILPNLFVGILPKSLIPVAEWATKNNFWFKTVAFYALSEEGAKDLEDRLRQYQGLLPDSVEVSYESTKPSVGGYGSKLAEPQR